MPLKYLPLGSECENAIKLYKLKDNGLTKAFDNFWVSRHDEFEKRLTALAKVVRLAIDLRKSKEVVAAGALAVK